MKQNPKTGNDFVTNRMDNYVLTADLPEGSGEKQADASYLHHCFEQLGLGEIDIQLHFG